MPARTGSTRSAATVALVVPMQGPAGIYGPSCELAAELAVEEVNEQGGILGREVALSLVDGGQAPQQVGRDLVALMRAEPVTAVVGWHISAVREALVPAIPEHVPYVYTAVYEGGSHRPGVFCAGETPETQVAPALRWLARERGMRRWAVVGNDYIWPRQSAAATRELLRGSGAGIAVELYVPLGTEDFSEVLRRLEVSGCDGVLMFLVGLDAILFNRQFAASGLDEECVRFSPLMEENVLLGGGPEGSRNLFAAAGYFEALATQECLEFGGRYAKRFGPDAPPLNSPGESCYEGVRLLAQMVQGSKTWEAREVAANSHAVTYEGPRGRVGVRRGHLQQTVYLSEADGVGFNVLCHL